MDHAEERRTVVVCGVPDILPCSRIADKLVIHFQRSRSLGGEVEKIQYPTHLQGVAFVTFINVQDADRVLCKDQLMEDREFPKEYPLTVFKFSQDVLFFLRAEVDLSIFSDQDRLIQALQAAHRSVRISAQKWKGSITVEGPFQAVKELREDLMKRLQTASHPSVRLGSEWTFEPR